jgi:hypothetical protein
LLQFPILTINQFPFCPFSPIDHVGVTFTIWWHLINSLEIHTSPMLVHYHDHMCVKLMSMINFMVITLSVCKLKCSFLVITLFFFFALLWIKMCFMSNCYLSLWKRIQSYDSYIIQCVCKMDSLISWFVMK